MNVYETENVKSLTKKKLLHFRMPDLIFNNNKWSIEYKVGYIFCFLSTLVLNVVVSERVNQKVNYTQCSLLILYFT